MNTRRYQMTSRADAAERTAQLLLDAMLARFRTTPYALIRLDDVAADAAVSVQTAIRRFGGKDQLTAALAAREIRRIAADRSDAAFASRETAVEALCAYYERDGDLIARFEHEAVAIPPLAELARAGRAVHLAWIEQVLGAGVAEGPDRDRRLAQLVAVLDVRCWQILRHERGLTASETRLALEELVRSIVR